MDEVGLVQSRAGAQLHLPAPGEGRWSRGSSEEHGKGMSSDGTQGTSQLGARIPAGSTEQPHGWARLGVISELGGGHSSRGSGHLQPALPLELRTEDSSPCQRRDLGPSSPKTDAATSYIFWGQNNLSQVAQPSLSGSQKRARVSPGVPVPSRAGGRAAPLAAGADWRGRAGAAVAGCASGPATWCPSRA